MFGRGLHHRAVFVYVISASVGPRVACICVRERDVFSSLLLTTPSGFL